MTDAQTTGAHLRAAERDRPATASTRRLVLLGTGAAGATVLLAACGTGSTGGNSSGSDFSDNPAPAGSAGTGDGGSPGPGSVIAAVADVPEGGGVITSAFVVTQPVAGTFKAFTKVCTHKGCDVSKIDSGVIVCPCHGSKYSIETGEPTNGPATKPLAETAVRVDGDNIVVA